MIPSAWRSAANHHRDGGPGISFVPAPRPIWQPWYIAVDDLTVLLDRSAAGDQGAFAELYDAVAPLVFGVVKRVLRDRAQAEEVTQEVFVNMWRDCGRYDHERGSVRTWAATIAHRRAVDRVRSEQAHRNRQERDALGATVPTDGPEDLAVDRESREPGGGRRCRC